MTTAENDRSTAEPIALRERASATPVRVERPVRARSETPPARDPGARLASLAHQQEWFVSAVMTPESEPAFGAALAASMLTPGPRLDPLGRLEIYRSAYHARLIECLLDDYPAVAATLGEAAFDELCRKYIELYPSTGSNLNSFGARVARLCRASAAERTELGAFVADLAALEWAIVEVIHAASADPLTMAALTDVPAERWAEARLVATPAFRLLRFEYPVNAYFQAFREGLGPAVPPPEPSAVAVYRNGPTIWRMNLGEAGFELLYALTRGRSLGESLAEASAAFSGIDESVAAQRVTGWFRDWVASGLFSAVELP